MPGVLIKTYGCQMNEQDSEQVLSMFLAGGYDITKDEAEAMSSSSTPTASIANHS